jgi:hypothetical protein
VESYQVITKEGNGVIHTVWAIEPKDKEAVYIKHGWLSEEWRRGKNY